MDNQILSIKIGLNKELTYLENYIIDMLGNRKLLPSINAIKLKSRGMR